MARRILAVIVGIMFFVMLTMTTVLKNISTRNPLRPAPVLWGFTGDMYHSKPDPSGIWKITGKAGFVNAVF